MVRTRLMVLALSASLGLVGGCMSSGGHHRGSDSCSCCDPCEPPPFRERLRYLFRPESMTGCGDPCCGCGDACGGGCGPCCDGCCPSCGPCQSNCGPLVVPPPAGNGIPVLPAPTPLAPQAAVPPLSPPPASRFVPQPQSQPQPYTPMFGTR